MTGVTGPAGDTVAAVFSKYFNDVDAGTTVGVAVRTLTGTADGSWQYSTNEGSNWIPFGSVSVGAVQLLGGGSDGQKIIGGPTPRIASEPPSSGSPKGICSSN